MSIDRKTKPPRDDTDWAGLRAMSGDVDNPATIHADEWAQARVSRPPSKTSIHASFDRDVVAFFKQDGRGYQTRMNAVLRRYMEAQRGMKPDR